MLSRTTLRAGAVARLGHELHAPRAASLASAGSLRTPQQSPPSVSPCLATRVAFLSTNAQCVCTLRGPVRCFASRTRVTLQQPTGSSASAGESALDVAMRVNRMKKAHQSAAGGSATRQQIEGDAWVALNTLSEEHISTAEGKAVALLLNSWAYFAKYWQRGKDGPAGAADPAAPSAGNDQPRQTPGSGPAGDAPEA